MNPETRLKLLIFISVFVLILSIVPFVGTYLNLLGKWLLLTVIAWHVSAAVTTKLLSRLLSPVDPQSKWILVSNCDTDYGIEVVKCLHLQYNFKIIAGFRDKNGLYADKLKRLNLDRNRVKVIELKCEDSDRLEETVRELGKTITGKDQLWSLVNLMSTISIGKAEWGTVQEQYKDVMDANVISAISLSRGVLPLLRASKGRIINVTDLPSKAQLPYHASWNMSSASLSFLTDCLRKEIFFFGIKVVSVEPDYYCTPFNLENHLIPALNKSWNATDETMKSADDFAKVKGVITSSHECNSDFICKKISQSIGTAVTAPSQCLEYKYIVSCTLNRSFLWFIDVIAPQEMQEAVLNLYRNVIGLSHKP